MTDEVKDNLVDQPETPSQEDNSQMDKDVQGNGTVADPKELRRAQQAAGSKQEVDKYKNIAVETAVRAVELDAGLLKELHEKDAKFAKEVAAKFDRSSSDYGSYDNFLQGKKVEKAIADDFDARYNARRAKEVHEEALEEAASILDVLPADKQDEAKVYFEKIVGDRLLTRKEAKEFAELATLYVSKDELLHAKKEKSEGLAGYASTGLSGKKATPKKEEMVTVVKNGKLVLVPNTFNV